MSVNDSGIMCTYIDSGHYWLFLAMLCFYDECFCYGLFHYERFCYKNGFAINHNVNDFMRKYC